MWLGWMEMSTRDRDVALQQQWQRQHRGIGETSVARDGIRACLKNEAVCSGS